jgi:lysosomal acid lipase/cholesteryl ester hydrolase
VKSGRGRPILLQTAAEYNADNWFKYVARDKVLPYMLVDLGFDVWLGNNRGINEYSEHISYAPTASNDAYWNFSFSSLGLYDLPAQIDFILQETREAKLSYIGYGRGNTQMFYGMVKKPGYFNARIR